MLVEDTSGLGTDIAIADDASETNQKRYPLALEVGRDGVARLGFRRLGSVDLHGADPRIPVWEEWDFGVGSGGMGQMRRRNRNSNNIYFTDGVDVTSTAGARLPPRKVTLTPTRVPVDKGAWFFEDTPDGNAVFNSGTLTAGDTTVAHGLSTTPALFIVTGTNEATAQDGSYTNDAAVSIGWSDGTNNAVVTFTAENGAGTSNTGRAYNNDACIWHDSDADGTPNDEAVVTSFDATNVNLTWAADSGSGIYQWIAIGGADVSASVDEFTLNTSTGNQSVTGVGFEPSLVLLLSALTTSTGFSSNAGLAMGAMDNSGNQFAASVGSQDNQSTSDSFSYASSTHALVDITLTNGSKIGGIKYSSMDADGFTFNVSDAAGSAKLVSALSIKGLQAKIVSFAKSTSTGNEPAQDPGFATEAFMVFGGNQTALDTTTDSASFGMSFVTAADEDRAMAFFDEDAQGTTDSGSAFDSASACLIVSDTAIIDEASCGNIDMGTAGWLNWATNSGAQQYLHAIGLAGMASSNTKMIHFTNGQSLTKMSVAANVITEEESHDWGAAAVSGQPAEFENVWYVPLGTEADAQKITAIGDSGTDNTYADVTHSGAGIKAHAFSNLQDGIVARIARGLNQYADTSADGSTWSGGADASTGFEIGDSSNDITNLIPASEGLHIGKTDNLYFMDTGGNNDPVTSFPQSKSHEHNGQGMVTFEGTDVVIYNHESGLFLFDGSSRPQRIAFEAILENGFYANITHEPYKCHYHECVTIGDYLYFLAHVTESSSTKTYIGQLKIDREAGGYTVHIADRLDGVARGLFVDSENRLWTGHVGGGVILYWKLGDDGSLDAGRDSIGHGAASETRRLYLGEIDMGFPYVLKQLRSVETITEGTHTEITLAPAFFHDASTEVTPLSAEVTAAGRTQLYVNTLGTNDTFFRSMAAVQYKTTGSYTNTGTDPLRLIKYRVNAFLRPQASDFADAYEIIINTGIEGSDGQDLPDDARTMRTNLAALKGAAPKYVTGPDGIQRWLMFTEVSEPEVLDTEDGVTWVIRLEAAEWINA